MRVVVSRLLASNSRGQEPSSCLPDYVIASQSPNHQNAIASPICAVCFVCELHDHVSAFYTSKLTSDIIIKSQHYSQTHFTMSLSSLLAPIALPLGSFLAIPMLSSWSTSLNLVFLSVAWTTIAATYSPLQLELFAPFVLRVSLYIIPSLVFLIFDVGVPSLSAEFKAQGQLGIPTRQRGGGRMVRRVAAWSCANVLLTVAVQAGIEFLVTDVLRMRSLLLIKGSKWGLNHLPYPWTMIKHAIIGLLSRNVSISKFALSQY